MNYKEAEERWKGKLGDEYLIRNYKGNICRASFWGSIKEKYSLKKILEVGCGDGHNLQFLQKRLILGKTLADVSWKEIDSYGIDVNKEAIYNAYNLDCMNVCYGSAMDIPFKDSYFDLVFTAGLLIHIPPDGILKAMQEIVRCSRRYVLCIEYWAEKEKERLFRGKLGITWERPYDRLYLDSFNLRLLEQGFLTKDNGFNDLSYFMFEKIE